jgi:Transglutaminase-like superfamily
MLGVVSASPTLAAPSEKFFKRGDDVYDSFDICRNRCAGEDGYMQLTEDGFYPIIVGESLGENIDVAWELGLTFRDKYPEPNQRAREIFNFVRNRVVYTSDVDEFGYQEFAQNADELAEAILKDGSSPGDCEDDAILLAVMYKAAGFRSAIVLTPGHAATLVYLPDYNKTTRVLTLEGESGWVWAEATGSTNSLGWFAPSLVDEFMVARELSGETVSSHELTYEVTSVRRESSTDSYSFGGTLPFFVVIFALWLFPAMRRKPTKRQR